MSNLNKTSAQEYIYYICQMLPVNVDFNSPDTIIISEKLPKFKFFEDAINYFYNTEWFYKPEMIIEVPVELCRKVIHINDIKIYYLDKIEEYRCLI